MVGAKDYLTGSFCDKSARGMFFDSQHISFHNLIIQEGLSVEDRVPVFLRSK